MFQAGEHCARIWTTNLGECMHGHTSNGALKLLLGSTSMLSDFTLSICTSHTTRNSLPNPLLAFMGSEVPLSRAMGPVFMPH